jgi:hypothetical protein
MRTSVLVLALATPLAVVGCKKEAPPEAAPAPAPAPAPDVSWTWGPATFAGSRSGSEVGKLTIPVTASTAGGKALIVSSYDIGVATEEGRVCVSRSDTVEKASDGTLGFEIKADCRFDKLPAGDELRLNGTVTYTFAGTEKKVDVKPKVAFKP